MLKLADMQVVVHVMTVFRIQSLGKILPSSILWMLAASWLFAQSDRPAVIAVMLKESRSPHCATLSGHHRKTLKHVGRASGCRLVFRICEPEHLDATLKSLREHPDVLFAQTRTYRKLCTTRPTDDARFDELWHLYNDGSLLTAQEGADVKYLQALSLNNPEAPEVIIGIMDTGVDYNHPDLSPNIWFNPGEIPDNNIDDDGNGFVDDINGWDFAGDVDGLGATIEPPDNDPMDYGLFIFDNSHGTHVAGIAAATANNGIGVAGVAYNAKILPLKVSADGDSIDTFATIEAIDYAIDLKSRGHNIVALNASYGGNFFNPVESAAMIDAANAGIIIVAAAGNDSMDNDANPHYPSSFSSPNIIAVAATGPDDELADFSHFGSTSVDIAAPGELILSTIATGFETTASVTTDSVTEDAYGFEYAGYTSDEGITGQLIDCGNGSLAQMPTSVAGNIALIRRGDLFFSEMVQNAETRNAAGVLVYDNLTSTSDPDALNNITGTLSAPSRYLPAVGVTNSFGQTLLSIAQAGGSVTFRHLPVEAVAYDIQQGTSMATPCVTGAVAIAAAHFPNDTMEQRVARVLSAVDVLPSLNGNILTGGRLNLQKLLDADNDTIGDWYEIEQTGQQDLALLSDTADYDKDGRSDADEFTAGTLANNAASYFSPTMVSITADTIEISWESVAGRYYTVMGSTDSLMEMNPLSNELMATPPLNTHTLQVSDGQPHFFRIDVSR